MKLPIDSKGYGRIYKTIMRDRSLPILAKAVYGYLCSFAGSGTKAFPKRNRIIRDLQMNKDTYTKHLNHLVQAGYIARERTARGNLYTVMQSVPCYDNQVQEIENATADRIIFENVGAHGFGTVPKLLMFDTRLTAQAKAIYAYFASFAGAGPTAFPRCTTVIKDLKIATAIYYEHFRLLQEAGYISVEHQKSAGGYDVCIYRLNDLIEYSNIPPGEPPPLSEKLEHGESDITPSCHPCPKNRYPIIWNTEISDMQG